MLKFCRGYVIPIGMRYPIQVVAKKTGLSPATLRAWEKRYHTIRPDRDENGRRLYSDESVRRLELLARLVEVGYRISDVVALEALELRGLLEELEAPEAGGRARDAEELLQESIEAVRRMEAPRLNRVLESAVAFYGNLELADRIIFPLLSKVERLLEKGELLPVHRSLLTSAISALLYSQLSSLSEDRKARRIAVAVPRGGDGTIGAIASMIHVVASGWYPVMLGGDVHPQELPEAIRASGAQALLLSIVTDRIDRQLEAELSAIAQQRVPVFFGGKMPKDVVAALEDLGLRHIPSMDALRRTLLVAAPR